VKFYTDTLNQCATSSTDSRRALRGDIASTVTWFTTIPLRCYNMYYNSEIPNKQY